MDIQSTVDYFMSAASTRSRSTTPTPVRELASVLCVWKIGTWLVPNSIFIVIVVLCFAPLLAICHLVEVPTHRTLQSHMTLEHIRPGVSTVVSCNVLATCRKCSMNHQFGRLLTVCERLPCGTKHSINASKFLQTPNFEMGANQNMLALRLKIAFGRKC